jgi:putative Mn2+ efflux pump MntP
MTIGRHLIYRLGLAAMQAALVVMAMIDRSVGIGVLIGIGVSAIYSAFRDHRRDRRRAVEAAELDQRLSATLAAIRQAAVDEKQRTDAVKERHWS